MSAGVGWCSGAGWVAVVVAGVAGVAIAVLLLDRFLLLVVAVGVSAGVVAGVAVAVAVAVAAVVAVAGVAVAVAVAGVVAFSSSQSSGFHPVFLKGFFLFLLLVSAMMIVMTLFGSM